MEKRIRAEPSNTTTARKSGSGSAFGPTQSTSVQPRPTQSGVAPGGNAHQRGLDVPNQSIPRVRFEQRRSNTSSSSSYPFIRHQLVGPIANLPVTARKAGSTPQSLRKQAQPVLSTPTSFFRKNVTPLKPLWKMLDEDHEQRSRKVKGDALGGAARRISSTSSRRPVDDKDTITISIDDPGRITARIGPGLKLTVVSANGEEAEESTGDERPKKSVNRPEPINNKPQIARKSGARKTKSMDVTPPSSPDGSEMEIDSDDGEDQLEDQSQTRSVETLLITTTTKRAGAKKTARVSTSPDLMILDSPPPAMKMKLQAPVLKTAPKITIPLAQLKPDPENELDDRAILYDIGNAQTIRHPNKTTPIPHDQLLEAVEALTLGVIRMQVTRRLPFLRRNLKQGFMKRCEALFVPIYRDLRKGKVSLSVIYEHVGESSYESPEKLDKWLCPLCTLFDEFETREMLDCHLKWDHREVFWDWEEVVDEDADENEERQSWLLTLTVPETFHSRASAIRESTFPEFPSSIKQPQQPRTPERSSTVLPTTAETTPTPANVISSPLPYVTLSPTTATPSQRLPLPTRIDRGAFSPASRLPPSATPSATPSVVKFSTPPPLTSRATSYSSTSLTTSTTSATATLSTVASSTSLGRTATPGPSTTPSPGPRYPTPPPRSNPRGPAAQKPYLPAHSEYGGPTVWYSCRPGGECLLDLLGTLPLEPFGLLAWEVLDREGEIFEADDIRDEYKVMHSLWARWSMLHRLEFIANYLEGTITFVDEYWKMIHRAAGWDALRYWLLMLLANRFLTGSDVAQVLLHYEELTGMANWYD
ncbi:hypothetical protein CPB83DRAFT_856154 [Crepidotus variabilis]|uniref:Uncharacterized protein n=1 Tax=Crepidotus variabilis TaxID=179855 RepID=A0A9P6EDH2_9AGAR|nr:hypothetical protein CPB83DRAFT_856154 [Crepidotus variabilis]